MSLINIGSLLTRTLQMLAKLEPPAGVELLSYKRNRAIAVTVLPDNTFQVSENGYEELELNVDGENLSRVLKTMIKREFPRSRKVRIFKFDNPVELTRPKNKI